MYVSLIKTAAELVVTAGVGTIVNTVVKEALPENLSKYKKITTTVGTFALSGMAGAAAASYASGQIDALVTGIKAGAKLAGTKKVVVVDQDDTDTTSEEK